MIFILFVLFYIFITLPWKISLGLKNSYLYNFVILMLFLYLISQTHKYSFFVFLRMHCLAVVSPKMILTVNQYEISCFHASCVGKYQHKDLPIWPNLQMAHQLSYEKYGFRHQGYGFLRLSVTIHDSLHPLECSTNSQCHSETFSPHSALAYCHLSFSKHCALEKQQDRKQCWIWNLNPKLLSVVIWMGTAPTDSCVWMYGP